VDQPGRRCGRENEDPDQYIGLIWQVSCTQKKKNRPVTQDAAFMWEQRTSRICPWNVLYCEKNWHELRKEGGALEVRMT